MSVLILALRNAALIECIHDVTNPTLGVAAFYAESNGGGPAVLANATNAGPGVHANSKQAARCPCSNRI